ncbi:MAG: transcriptional repressor NrdR [Deltaproteobacteria bacterium]|nr:transcriptional repressor NrdR [Deltaproteobacteria bacterium]
MKCPYCGGTENKVIDSRLSKEGTAIRRRRDCAGCGRRFTTYERVEEILPMVVKKDNRREPFSRSKIYDGIRKAVQKRPVSVEKIEAFLEEIERGYQESSKKEVPSREIGEKVIAKLKEWDEVAYVRFASVYRQFADVNEFMSELEELIKERKKKTNDWDTENG